MYCGIVITDEVRETCIEIIKAGLQNAMSDGEIDERSKKIFDAVKNEIMRAD